MQLANLQLPNGAEANQRCKQSLEVRLPALINTPQQCDPRQDLDKTENIKKASLEKDLVLFLCKL